MISFFYVFVIVFFLAKFAGVLTFQLFDNNIVTVFIVEGIVIFLAVVFLDSGYAACSCFESII